MSTLVEYQFLRPRQMIARRNAMPVAYIGLGILEWHGLHNPLGLDGVKANGIACYIANKLGGVVMPPQYWGDFRGDIGELNFDASFRPSFSTPENSFDHTVLISDILEVEKEAFVIDAKRSEQYGQWNLWEGLMVRTMFQIETLGFKAIILIPGHYPLFRPLNRAIERYIYEGGKCKTLSLKDTMYADNGSSGDHAAAFETSLMLALYPELTDLNELDSDLSKPNIGIIGLDPRTNASRKFGQQVLKKFFEISENFVKDILDKDLITS